MFYDNALCIAIDENASIFAICALRIFFCVCAASAHRSAQFRCSRVLCHVVPPFFSEIMNC